MGAVIATNTMAAHEMTFCDFGKRIDPQYCRTSSFISGSGRPRIADDTGAVGGFLTMPVQHWRDAFAVNVDGILNTARAAIPHLIKSKGSIINVSSVSGHGGDRGLSFYNATKGAVCNFTRSLAIEFAQKGVRVNSVCPTTTFTDLTTPVFEQHPELLQRLLERIPTPVTS